MTRPSTSLRVARPPFRVRLVDQVGGSLVAIGDVGDLEEVGQGLLLLTARARHVGRHIRRPEFTGGLGGEIHSNAFLA